MSFCAINISFCKLQKGRYTINNPRTAYKVINIINIRVIRHIRRFDLDETFHYPGEKHDYWEAVYISKGAALVTAGTQAPAFVLPSREYPADHIVNNAKKIMLDAVYAPSISSDDLCQQLGYSRTYLCRIFKEECNCTITQYMNQLKIEEAPKLIREENYNFTQISDMLHFANSLYFSRVFRRITDMSPSEYQKLVKANLSGR